jgi:hypothetical protein
MMPKRLTTSQRQYLTQRVKPFVLQKGVLHRSDEITRFIKSTTKISIHSFARITWRSCRKAFFF